MLEYTDEQRQADFEYYKEINPAYFKKHGRRFIAIRNKVVLGDDVAIRPLIERMKRKKYPVGTYIIQNCTGDENGYTVWINRLGIKVGE